MVNRKFQHTACFPGAPWCILAMLLSKRALFLFPFFPLVRTIIGDGDHHSTPIHTSNLRCYTMIPFGRASLDFAHFSPYQIRLCTSGAQKRHPEEQAGPQSVAQSSANPHLPHLHATSCPTRPKHSPRSIITPYVWRLVCRVNMIDTRPSNVADASAAS
jgi:hypothetical protein